MATLKDYASQVKKIASSTGEARADAIKAKAAIVEQLHDKAKDRAELRKLKFAMDEVNNS